MLNKRPNPDIPPEPPDGKTPVPGEWRKWIFPGVLLFFLVWVVLTSGSLMGSPAEAPGERVPFSVIRNQAAAYIATLEIDSYGVFARGTF
jgi:hypothetical protein